MATKDMFVNIRDKVSIPTAGGAATGAKKKMSKQELAEFQKKKAKETKEIALAEAQGNAFMGGGKTPVKLWEADASRLSYVIDEKGVVFLKYNHGTPEKPEMHTERIFLPLARVGKASMLRGIGSKYDPEEGAQKQESKGPRDWMRIFSLRIGLPLPAHILAAFPEAVEQDRRAVEYLLAREDYFATVCATDQRAYPHLRKKEAEAVERAKVMFAKPTEEQILMMKKNFWIQETKRGVEKVMEVDKDGNSKMAFLEITLKTYTFMPQYEGKKKELPAEVQEVLDGGSTDEKKIEAARTIKDAYDKGFCLTELHINDINKNPIKCSVFGNPLHDNDLVLTLASVSYYSNGTNNGFTHHNVVTDVIQPVNFAHGHAQVDSSDVVKKLKQRSPLEIRILRMVKACVAEGGLSVMDLIDDDTDTAKLTAALNGLVRDKLIAAGASREHFVMVDKDLDIDTLPTLQEEGDDESDYQKIVELARAALKKQREEDAKAKAEKEAKEAAEAEKQKRAADVAAGLNGGAAPVSGDKPSADAIRASMSAMTAPPAEDDEDQEAPAVKRQKMSSK
jgi:hypothetical protein